MNILVAVVNVYPVFSNHPEQENALGVISLLSTQT